MNLFFYVLYFIIIISCSDTNDQSQNDLDLKNSNHKQNIDSGKENVTLTNDISPNNHVKNHINNEDKNKIVQDIYKNINHTNLDSKKFDSLKKVIDNLDERNKKELKETLDSIPWKYDYKDETFYPFNTILKQIGDLKNIGTYVETNPFPEFSQSKIKIVKQLKEISYNSYESKKLLQDIKKLNHILKNSKFELFLQMSTDKQLEYLFVDENTKNVDNFFNSFENGMKIKEAWEQNILPNLSEALKKGLFDSIYENSNLDNLDLRIEIAKYFYGLFENDETSIKKAEGSLINKINDKKNFAKSIKILELFKALNQEKKYKPSNELKKILSRISNN